MCLFYENNNLKNAILLYVSEGFRNLKSNCQIIVLSAPGTSGLSKFINMKRLDIKLGKERQCHITKQLVHSFSINIRISQP